MGDEVLVSGAGARRRLGRHGQAAGHRGGPHRVPPALPGLFFIGLVQPIGAIMPVAEAQSQWVADLLDGWAALPPELEMNREITRYRTATARRYERSGGQAIQVDFLPYLREIRKERRAGARRRPADAGYRRTGPTAASAPAPAMLPPKPGSRALIACCSVIASSAVPSEPAMR
jgi:flavin-binding monooxygenase-like protein